jgi:hypothetical protein
LRREQGNVQSARYSTLKGKDPALQNIFLFRGLLAIALSIHAVYRTFTAGRTLEAGANFGKIEAKFSHCPAQGVAMHAEFFGSFALVAPVCHKDLAQVLALEFADRFFIADTA